jgi:hypothetical protein
MHRDAIGLHCCLYLYLFFKRNQAGELPIILKRINPDWVVQQKLQHNKMTTTQLKATETTNTNTDAHQTSEPP